MKALLLKAWALVYPPTKTKLHRLLHLALSALAVTASVLVWVQGQRWGWSTWNQIEAQAVLLGTYVARAASVFRTIDSVVDKLPIPDGTTVTQTTATTTTTEAVTTLHVLPVDSTEAPTPVLGVRINNPSKKGPS